MDKPFDATMKQMVDQQLPDWARFIAGRLNLPLPLRLSPLDGDVSTVNLQADKLFRMSGSTEGIVHVEFQTMRDSDLPRRVMRYSMLANARYDLPVYSVVLLLTQKADFAGMTGEFILEHGNGEAYHRFSYDVVRVWELPAKLLLEGGTGLMPLVMLTGEAKADPKPIFREMVERSRKEIVNPGHHREFMAKALILAGLSFDEEMMMVLSEEVSRLSVSSMYQIIHRVGEKEGIEKGRVEGLFEGRVEGLVEGRVEGRIEGLEIAVRRSHEFILKSARLRLGMETQADRSALEALSDLVRLDLIFDRIPDAKSWEDLLATE